MYALYKKKTQRVPIKAWVGSYADLETSCWSQAVNLANLPFVHKCRRGS